MVVCLLTGLILCLYCGKGRLHDFKLWKDSQWRLTPDTALYVDLGFLGIDQLHSKSVLPFKASKKHPLTKEQKKHNRKQAAISAPIEHVNRQCKIFRIVKDTYRGKHKNYGLNWNYGAPKN